MQPLPGTRSRSMALSLVLAAMVMVPPVRGSGSFQINGDAITGHSYEGCVI